MISRLPKAARGIRSYSTDSDAFLTRLLSQIDTINKAKAAPATKNVPHKKSPGKVANSVKVVVKDHPLSNNTFKRFNERRSAGAAGSGSAAGRGYRSDVSGSAAGRGYRSDVSGSAAGRGNKSDVSGSAARRGNKQDVSRSATGRNRNNSASRRQNTQSPPSIVPKKLVETAYKPALSGDVFFHGKIGSLGLHTGSRVAAVAKNALIKSKYPYKLPRSVIESVDENFAGNDFLLQKDWSLDVDAQDLGQRMRHVVKGEVQEVSVGRNADDAVLHTQRELMRSGDLSLEKKQMVLDLASGSVDAKDLFKDAAWNKAAK